MNQSNIDKLNVLKQQFGKEAIFRSKAGFKFNAFDDTWTLGPLGNKGERVSLVWLHDAQLSGNEQITVRFALAAYAKTRAVNSVRACITVVKNSSLAGLSVIAFKSAWLDLPTNYKSLMKLLITALVEYDEMQFTSLSDWASGIKFSKKAAPIYDPVKGALSDAENQAFDVAMNQRSKAILVRQAECGDDIEWLRSYRNFLATRFAQVLVRRPINLIQMKWSDIHLHANAIDAKCAADFDDDDELKVRMFKAKQKGGHFRAQPEAWPLILNNAVSKEVLRYRQAYQSRLLQSLEKRGITLNESELNELMSRCPVFFVNDLFHTEFASIKQTFAAFSKDGQGFHLDSQSLIGFVKYQFQSLHVISERVSPDQFRIGNNRIRHTVGTKAASGNIHESHIAKMLGNTIKAAKVYVDLSNEGRAAINKKFVGNTFLATAFSTSISTVLEEYETAIASDLGEEVGKSKNVAVCVNCARQKPLGCYGCNNFAALACANHRTELIRAEGLYDHRIKAGDHPNALLELDRQIENIKATIVACDSVLLQQAVLEVDNEDQI